MTPVKHGGDKAPPPNQQRMRYPCAMALDERDFFNEKQDQEGPHSAGRRRARSGLYAKLRDYMIRVDDVLHCQSCRTRFEVPSHQSLVFLQEGERQPNS
jgi:hypothetical protein